MQNTRRDERIERMENLERLERLPELPKAHEAAAPSEDTSSRPATGAAAPTASYAAADMPYDQSFPAVGAPPTPTTPGAGGAHEQRTRHPQRVLLALLVVLVVVAGSLGGGIIGARLVTPQPATTAPAALSASSQQTVALSPNVADLQQAVENVSQGVQPSVVMVTSENASRQPAIGSAVVLTASGYLVTNDHVVAGYSRYQVTLSTGATAAARLVGEDQQDDLAVLKIAASSALQPIRFADPRTVRVGQFVVAIGAPLGLARSATLGIVSALGRTVTEASSVWSGTATELTGLIQTSAPLNPGNSGGALVDLQGRLVGMPTLRALGPTGASDVEGISFAIPAARVQAVATQLMRNG